MNLGTALKVLGPRMVKAVAVAAPLLKNEKVQEALLDVASKARGKTPVTQLRTKIEATAAVAVVLADEATSDTDRERAEAWGKQAANLLRVLDLPSANMRGQVNKLASVRKKLAALQDDIERSLTTG